MAEIEKVVQEGRDFPKIEFADLLEIGEIGPSLFAYRLRFPQKTANETFNPSQIRIDARHAFANKLFLITIPQAIGIKKDGVFLMGGKVTRVLGLYPNAHSIREEAACNGWLVTERELACASDFELRRVWDKRPHPKTHPLWS